VSRRPGRGAHLIDLRSSAGSAGAIQFYATLF